MNKETENSVIGSILINPSLIDNMAEILKPTDFATASLGLIYAKMLRLADQGEMIDVVSVAECLGDELPKIGGMNYLSTILTTTPSAANALSYARVVKDFSNRAKLASTLTQALDLANGSRYYDDAIAAVSEKLSALDPETNGYLDFSSLVGQRIAELDRRSTQGTEIEGITTGFKLIDQRLLGLSPGDLWVVGARPGMGKTALALNIAHHVSKNHGPVLFFSCEMTRAQLTDRSLVAASKINGRKFRTAKLNDLDWQRIGKSADGLKKLPLHIIDNPSIDVNLALSIARKFDRRNRLALIVIDYLQLLRFKNTTGYDCVTEVSRCLKNMAKLIGCPVLALAQLNRAVESRVGDKRPNSADLRSSGQIEQDADVISFIYRDEIHNPNSADKGIAELITTKVRNGEMGTDILGCDMSTFRFYDCDVVNKKTEPVQSYKPFSKSNGFNYGK